MSGARRMARHVAVVGAGFSGTMLAVHLVREGNGRVTLIERGDTPGRGLAYGAAHPTHLLNVPAGKMSAFPDQPDHLVRWLERTGRAADPAAFVPRRRFGDYLEDVLRQACAEAGDRLEIVRGAVEALEPTGTGYRVQLSGGRSIAADAAVLALGNAPPQPPRSFDPAALPPGVYVGDPWQPGLADGLTADDPVLIIGAGLTMVDVALLLEEQGFAGPILALSRRGLLPRAHAPGAPAPSRSEVPVATASALLHEVRRRSDALGWRAAVDELRPVTQALWHGADPATRGRFLRHLRPWWDVHRHRIAPQVAGRIQAMVDAGQLRVAAGKLANVAAIGEQVEISWRPRGQERLERTRVARIINCTGPEANLRATADPLLHRLLDQGTIRPDPLGIGIDVDQDSRVIAPDGTPSPHLFALGPLTRGAFWEIIAVPDIRHQAFRVALQLV